MTDPAARMDHIDHPLADLAERYRFSAKMLAAIAGGLEEADWRKRAGDGSHALWLLAHVTVSKRGLLRGIGVACPVEPWEAIAARGTKPDAGELPAPPVLLAAWHEANQALCERLAAMSSADAARPFPRTLPDGSNTAGAVAAFLLFHEGYHFGQIGLLRRLCGKPGAI